MKQKDTHTHIIHYCKGHERYHTEECIDCVRKNPTVKERLAILAKRIAEKKKKELVKKLKVKQNGS